MSVTASDIVNSVNILIALRWLAKAWSLAREKTIAKCFRKAGILNADLDVISCDLDAKDDMRLEFQSLIDKAKRTIIQCRKYFTYI